jgi:putative transposase
MLRRHRVSMVGATYFVTACVLDRKPVLTLPAVASAVNDELRGCEASGHIQLLASALMPDHIHALLRLTGNLAVQRVLARIKAKTRAALAGADAQWQPNFFEHRLRPDEPLEPVVRYVFQNPYRKRLLTLDAKWPWFWQSAEIAAWFNPTINNGLPFPEWLAIDE